MKCKRVQHTSDIFEMTLIFHVIDFFYSLSRLFQSNFNVYIQRINGMVHAEANLPSVVVVVVFFTFNDTIKMSRIYRQNVMKNINENESGQKTILNSKWMCLWRRVFDSLSLFLCVYVCLFVVVARNEIRMNVNAFIQSVCVRCVYFNSFVFVLFRWNWSEKQQHQQQQHQTQQSIFVHETPYEYRVCAIPINV